MHILKDKDPTRIEERILLVDQFLGSFTARTEALVKKSGSELNIKMQFYVRPVSEGTLGPYSALCISQTLFMRECDVCVLATVEPSEA